MESNGWIKVDRNVLKNWTYNYGGEPYDYFHAWMDLLLNARYTEEKTVSCGVVVNLKPGQLIISVRKLSEKWHWSIGKTRNFISNAEKQGMILTDKYTYGTIVTIVNWRKYQVRENTNGYTYEHTNGYADSNTVEYDYKERKKEKKGEKPSPQPVQKHWWEG